MTLNEQVLDLVPPDGIHMEELFSRTGSTKDEIMNAVAELLAVGQVLLADDGTLTRPAHVDALAKAETLVRDPIARAATLIAGLADGYVTAARLSKDKENDLTQARVLMQTAFEVLHRLDTVLKDKYTAVQQRDYDTAEEHLEAVGNRFEKAGGEW